MHLIGFKEAPTASAHKCYIEAYVDKDKASQNN